MISNKRGMMGEGLLMIYRLVLISFIALIILGLSAVFYDYYLDVRDAEARIIARDAVNCLAPEGVVNLVGLNAENDKKFLEGCGFDSDELDRVYVNATIVVDKEVVKELGQGDSGARWVYELFDKGGTESIKKYKPGYYKSDFKVNVDGGEKEEGLIKLEVFVNHEF